MEINSDPWDWTVEEVIQRISKEAKQTNRLPPLDLLLTNLRDNDVCGEVFLIDITHAYLKDDWGIKSLGQRSAIISIITKLRHGSLRYQSHIEENRLNGSFALPPGIAETLQLIERKLGDSPSAAEQRPILQEQTPPPNNRTKEYQVIDEQGRKRRKLRLSGPAESLNSLTPNSTSQVVQPTNPTSDTFLTAKTALHEQSSLSEGVSADHVKRVPFLGAEPFPIEKLFFGETPIGAEIEGGNGSDMEVTIPHVVAEDRPVGFQQYVHQQLKYSLMNDDNAFEVPRLHQTATAVLPYRKALVKSGRAHSVLLIHHENDRWIATREDSRFLDRNTSHSPPPESTREAVKNNSKSDWDFLAHWVEEDNSVLPPYGESGSEVSCSESLIEEIAEEKQDEKQGKTLLSQDQVENIIGECVEQYVDLWKRKKLPLKEHLAWSTWRQARGRRMRQELSKIAQNEVDRLLARLQKLQSHILQQPWQNKAEVKTQCVILEETISQCQEQAWKHSLWQQATAPEKPKRKLKTVKKKLATRTGDGDNDDEDFLDNDSEELASEQYDTDEPSHLQEDGPNSSPAPTAQASDQAVPSNHMEVDQDSDAIYEGTPALVLDKDKADEAEEFTEGGAIEESEAIEECENLEGAIINEGETGEETQKISPVLSEERQPANDVKFETETIPYDQAPTLRLLAVDQTSLEEIAEWSTYSLMDRSDRRGLLIKLLFELSSSERYSLFEATQEHVSASASAKPDQSVADAILKYLKSTSQSPQHNGHDPDPKSTRRLARLFFCFWHCSNKYIALTEDRFQEEISTITDITYLRDDIKVFADNVRNVLQLWADRDPEFVHDSTASDNPPPSETQPIYIHISSSDEESEPENLEKQNTPSRRRVKKVKRNQEAVNLRKQAAERQKQAESRLREIENHQASTPSKAGQKSSIIINTECTDEAGLIYINEIATERLKPHQTAGLRFMWREVVAGATSEGGQGCLLAHTMGLGKTMQAITFLVTVAEAARSSDPKIYAQIPTRLRKRRALVVCPPSLIQNWVDEFEMWTPKPKQDNVGSIFTIEADQNFDARLEVLRTWHESTGVLIMGYEMLVLLTSKSSKGVSDEIMAKTRAQLLGGPSIVILDEAHKIKNRKAKVSETCGAFKTKARIALTGSPLANSLSEYFEMIDWVAPGFLGSPLEFRAHFLEPIEEGLYQDSTDGQYRKAMKTLWVLNEEIGPKVLRADISVMKGDLPPKTEFMIKIPLTKMQTEIYGLYVGYLQGKFGSDAASMKLLTETHNLGLICAHPYWLYEKLTSDKDGGSRSKAASNNASDVDLDESAKIWTLFETGDLPSGTSDGDDSPSSVKLIEAQKKVISKYAGAHQIKYSHKLRVLHEIIKLSKCAGDQVLIFTHVIKSLDHVENILSAGGISYLRLDGSVKTSVRADLVNRFREQKYDVFLISTRAGGLGLNLPSANRVVIFDFGFNPTWEEQAIGRAYRYGQTKPVYVYRLLVGGTFEEKVNNRAVYKTQLFIRAVDQKNPKSAAPKIKDLLQMPKEVPQEPLDDYLHKDPAVLDVILSQSGHPVRGITLTETFVSDTGEKLNQQEMEEAAMLREMYRNLKNRAIPSVGSSKAPVATVSPPPVRPSPYIASTAGYTVPFEKMKSRQNPNQAHSSSLSNSRQNSSLSMYSPRVVNNHLMNSVDDLWAQGIRNALIDYSPMPVTFDQGRPYTIPGPPNPHTLELVRRPTYANTMYANNGLPRPPQPSPSDVQGPNGHNLHNRHTSQ